MAQTGFTPISTYYTTTASAVPTAGNLVNGELALNINTADGKLFYKDSAGVVQVIASKASNSGSFTTITTTGVVTAGGGAILNQGLYVTNANAPTGASGAALFGGYSSGATTAFIQGYNSTTSAWIPMALNGSVITFGSGASATEVMRIDSSGNVGIGTNNPGQKLTINSANTSTNSLVSFSQGGVTQSNVGMGSDNNMYVQVVTARPTIFINNNAESMRIDSSGNVGINTATPSTYGTKLVVYNNQMTVTGSGYDGTFADSIFFAGNAEGTGYRHKISSSISSVATDSQLKISVSSGISSFVDSLTMNGTGAVALSGAAKNVSGVGIVFPATQSASSNANTLDDYEEGTWTATITTSGGSVTIGSQSCNYTKVGRMVVLNGSITLSAISSPTGQCTITNLPFVPALSASGGISLSFANVNTTVATGLYLELNTTPRIYIGKTTTLNAISDTADLLSSTTIIRFGVSYSV